MPYKTIPHIKREDITVIDNITGLFKINNCGIICRLGNFFSQDFDPTKFFGDAYIDLDNYVGVARRLAKDESTPLQIGDSFTADSPQWIQIEGDYSGWYLHCEEKCMVGEDGVYKLKPFSDLIDIFKQGGVLEGVNWFDYYYGPVDEPFEGTLTAFARIELDDILTEDDWDMPPAPTEGGWIRDLVRGEHTVAELLENLEGTDYYDNGTLMFGIGTDLEGSDIQVQVEHNNTGWSRVTVLDTTTWDELDDVPDNWFPDVIAYVDYSDWPYRLVQSDWDDTRGTLKANNSYMGKIYRGEIDISELMETLGVSDVSDLGMFIWTVDGEPIETEWGSNPPSPLIEMEYYSWLEPDGPYWEYLNEDEDIVDYPSDAEMHYIWQWSWDDEGWRVLPWDDELGQPIIGGLTL